MIIIQILKCPLSNDSIPVIHLDVQLHHIIIILHFCDDTLCGWWLTIYLYSIENDSQKQHQSRIIKYINIVYY